MTPTSILARAGMLFLVGLLTLAVPAQGQISSEFSYQGELRLLGTPTAGDYDFRFRLYGVESGGTRIGPELLRPGLVLEDGIFSVLLDFGPTAFSGAARWLEIDVRATGDTSWETLAPRTLLSTVPYAWGAALALPGSVNSASIQAGAVGQTAINSAQVQRRVSGICAPGSFVSQVNADGSVVCATGGGGASGWLLDGNAGTNPALDYLGTSDNQPLVLRANAQALARFTAVAIPGTSDFTANIQMGSPDNIIRSGVRGAVISGGGVAPTSPDSIFNPNVVNDHFGTIGGGHANVAGTDDGDPANSAWATVGGGVDNRALGSAATVSGGEVNIALANFSSVGGGQKNLATETGSTVSGGQENRAAGITSTVAGGNLNSATGLDAVVSGGGFNTASGRSSVVAGGELNCAGGTYSWAGGRRAKVRPGALSGAAGEGCQNQPTAGSAGDQGTFIWADSQNVDFQSSGINQFLVRASGGVFFGSAGPADMPAGRFINTDTGAHLTTGGIWTNNSSRVLKTDFLAVDPIDILDRLISLPMSTWRYTSAPDNGRHLGPVAEDFHARFGLGADDASITTVDASGVALAAIQGLNQRLQDENASLRQKNADQDAAIAALRAELDELRSMLLPAVVQEP